MQKNTPKNISSSDEINIYLSAKDPVMEKIIQVSRSVSSSLEIKYFEKLCKTIIGQQLSNKVAKTITQRFMQIFDLEITPDKIINCNEDDLRKIGISYSKISYLKNLSIAVIEGSLPLEQLEYLSDADVINLLTKVKGIGPWSAEMFLIFSLGRQNIFSVSDGGLKSVIKNLYFKSEKCSLYELYSIAEKWSPYKSIASLFLWDLINRDLLKEVSNLVNPDDD